MDSVGKASAEAGEPSGGNVEVGEVQVGMRQWQHRTSALC